MKTMKYFKISEFLRSNVADLKSIPNEATTQALVNLSNLAHYVLDPAREYIGVPIYITSGYRSRALNAAVGGVQASQHCTGHAADITITDKSRLPELYQYIAEHLIYDQLIYYRSGMFMHVSYVTHRYNRQQTIIKR